MLDYSQNLLESSVSTIKGVGPKKVEIFARLGIRTIGNLLEYFPSRYEDRRKVYRIKELRPGVPATFFGKVLRLRGRPLKILVGDESAAIELVFFYDKFIKSMLIKGRDYMFYGTPQFFGDRLEVAHPEFFAQDKYEAGIIPIYKLTGGLKQAELRRFMRTAVDMLDYQVFDFIPEKYITKHRLAAYLRSLQAIHFPNSERELQVASYRLIYNEFFMLNLGLRYVNSINEDIKKGIKFSEEYSLEKFSNSMPFDLTGAQERIIGEIFTDMESPKVMYRLVAGDVGSGKTAVAMAAMLKAVNDGYQAAYMAPTEILASQHFNEITRLFPNTHTALLTSSMKAKDRKELLNALSSGEIDILVGTHALISTDVLYHNLGIAITDEQHRFGVSQRKRLSSKGRSPEVLVMSATPIPRSLAWVIYGDLDMSILDEMPKGRKPILTSILNTGDKNKAYEAISSVLEKGQQAYIVAPIIDESYALEGVISVNEVWDYAKKYFPKHRVGLLHGEFKQEQKDEIMRDFIDKKIDVLCATVVIEVGIDVKNATIMVIENAERFGLAQLHQLRGRVGRSDMQSHCVLILEEGGEKAMKRAKALVENNDGFLLAEKDLQFRGSGELLGLRQHGLINLKIADIYDERHRKILDLATQDVKDLCEETSKGGRLLCGEEYDFLRSLLTEKLEAGNIGI